MKTLIILLFTISFCFGQNAKEKETQQKLSHKWELKQFEDAEKKGAVVTVTLVKYADNVTFDFKEDQTLEVIYSASKTEKYFWEFKGDLMEIKSDGSQNFNPEILGIFEVHFQDKISQLFLQRKNDPHHGIMLKQ
ncbi:hypothetical protein [Flavobacterium pallidum]|uniref:Lipocalin-like domain-containing protein n=1 Tax=Flavobacterium pallidum TaxID=2172098 RepID=A0A2S1SDH3_9FLAO|nr:hypothetical protein [Flavobacterium pallidum]AWI24414.1 hypothetical protein HYN49_00080 [Flavobacterium pallidum]